MNEGVSLIDQDVARQTKQLGAPGPIDCALLGRKVSQTECSSASLKASASDFERCLSCATGRTLAATRHVHHAPWRPDEDTSHRAAARNDDALATEAAEQADVVDAPVLHGWELVKARTGFESHSQLAKEIRKAQPSVSLAFRTAAAGKVPGGPTVQAILDYANITMGELIGRPLTPEERDKTPAEETQPPAAPPTLTTEIHTTEAPAETSTEDHADLDVAMSRRDLDAEPDSQSDADIEAARPPVDISPLVCPPGLAEVRTEAMLHELRRRLPGMTVTIQIPA